MANEEKTETTATTTETESTFSKFNDAMDAIQTENEKSEDTETVETEVEETPAGEETVEQEVSEEKTETTVSEETATSESETLKGIDPDVLECCRDYGWDDNKIATIAKTSPELLEDVRELLDEEKAEIEAETTESVSTTATKEPETREFEELKFDLDPDIVGSEVKNAIDKMAMRLNEQAQSLSEEKNRLQTERDIAYYNRVDACFDRYSQDLAKEAKKAGNKKPVIDLGISSSFDGKTFKQLPYNQRQQVRLRGEIFRHALVTAEIRRLPIEKAIAIEINRFKNQDGDIAAERRLLGKLQKQERRYTHPPSRRHSMTDFKNRKFSSEAERITALMDEAHRQAGDED